MTDASIIQLLRSSDFSGAMKGVYRYFPAIRQYIFRHRGNVEDAEDIFQDALLILQQKLTDTRFELSSSLQAYLMGIVRNCWHQELRRRQQLPPGTEIDVPMEIAINEEMAMQQAQSAFHLLGEKCRELLILFYYRQKSYREIAQLLSFSDERVAKNQKYRCLEKAKSHFVELQKNNSHE